MKFSCTQENLKRGLMTVTSIAGKNVNLPVLNNVLIKAGENSIEFLSTNLEIAVRCIVRGKVETAGEFTVPSKLFLDYVNLLPDERVDVELDDQTISVSCGKNATKIKGLPASEFPLIPNIERKAVIQVGGDSLKEAMGQVNFAVSTIESRPELTGVLFNINPQFAPGRLVMAATDSYRLSEVTIKLESRADKTSTDRPMSVIVPGRTLAELARIASVFKDQEISEGGFEFILGDNQAAFKFGPVELISRLIEARYPDYRPIIPERFSTEVVLSKVEFIQAVKSSALFSRAGLQDIRLEIDPKEGLRVSSGEGQTGRNDSLVAAKVTGEPNGITVNYRYLLDGLSAINSPYLRFKMIDGTNPCVIVPEPMISGEGFLYIVMPIKQ